jgi:hypothetical protein
VFLPTRLASGTLIDNIFMNNLKDKIEAILVTVKVSDHLPIFAMLEVLEGLRIGDWDATRGGG